MFHPILPGVGYVSPNSPRSRLCFTQLTPFCIYFIFILELKVAQLDFQGVTLLKFEN